MTSVSNADVSRREGPPKVETPGAKDRIRTTLTLIELFLSDDTCPLDHRRVLSGKTKSPRETRANQDVSAARTADGLRPSGAAVPRFRSSSRFRSCRTGAVLGARAD